MKPYFSFEENTADVSRREFLRTSALLVAAGLAGSAFAFRRSKQLSFSTLGCPDWTFARIVDFAVKNNFQGIELRGIQRQLDLTKCPEFSVTNKAATLQLMKDHQLKFSDLGSSCTLHFPDSAERTKNLDEGKRFIDLAHEIGCPNVRVFPNNFLKERSKNETMDLIAKGLVDLGNHAKGSHVNVLVESHGDLIHADDLLRVMEAATHKHVGMIWDVTNMWIETQEPVLEVYTKLKKYIRHTHIKDAIKTDGKINYVRLGKGKVPIFEAIDLLRRGGYQGYYSFEWEKLWHPEIEEPELAIANYAEVMQAHFKLPR
ncbi:MAG: TIM barrel protein [Bacteroidetes bacterium]|nr:TIM barrel protein [Bacteroidota bacterium]